MYITEIRFRHGVWRDTQMIHRTILGAIGSDNPGRVLWAVPTRDMLIVQADVPIASDSIGTEVVTHSAQIETRHETGSRVRLSLIANPVQVESAPRGVRGKRRPLPINQHEAWLRRKLAGAVNLDEVDVQSLGSRTGKRGDAKVTHRLSAFYAIGTVIDTDRLESLILDGVGPAKAYGAGLLMVGAA